MKKKRKIKSVTWGSKKYQLIIFVLIGIVILLFLGYLFIFNDNSSNNKFQNNGNLNELNLLSNDMSVQGNTDSIVKIFEKIYNSTDIEPNDKGNSILVDEYKNIFICGAIINSGNNDDIILKYDPDGNLIWKKTWGTLNNNYCFNIEKDNSGYIYSLGYYDKNYSIYKFDYNGNIIWGENISGYYTGRYTGLAIVPNNEYAIVMQNNNNEYTLNKFDNNGNLEFNKTIIGLSGGNSNNILINNNNIYIAGRNPISKKINILKLDASGNTLFNKDIDLSSFGVNGISTDNSYIYITISSPYTLVKIDFNGNVIWIKNLAFPPHSILIKDNILMSGTILNNGIYQLYLAKYDFDGNEIVNKTFNPFDDGNFINVNDIFQDSDSFYGVGESGKQGGSFSQGNIYFAKFNNDTSVETCNQNSDCSIGNICCNTHCINTNGTCILYDDIITNDEILNVINKWINQ
jgi:hypothetical protein